MMTLNIPHYFVKSAEIRTAAIFELVETVIENGNVEGLTAQAASLLKNDYIDKLIPELIKNAHVELALLLAPLNAGMAPVHQRLWTESIYEFYCAHNTSLPLLSVFFPDLTRRKHEKYMKRNMHLLLSKKNYPTEEEESAIYAAFRELRFKFPQTDIRELYMMLQERFVEIAMTTLVRQTAAYFCETDAFLSTLNTKISE